MPNKHICFVNYQVGHFLGLGRGVSGGAESQVFMLARAMAKQGYRVSVLTELDEAHLAIERWQITWHHVPFSYLGGSKTQVFANWYSLVRKLQELRPDVVHMKHPRHLLMPVGLACRANRSRLFFHAAIDKDFDRLAWAREPKAAQVLYRIGLGMVAGVIAQTERQEAQIREVASVQVHRVANIFLAQDDPSTEIVPERDVFLWVGSNSARKRPEVFAALARELPELEFVMVYGAGDGTGAIDTMAVPNNLRLVGQLPRDELNSYYRRATALISTSELEGFPNVFLESWSCETPVFSLDVDPDGVITEHELGRVVSSAQGLIELCRNAQKNEPSIRTMGKNGARYIQQCHGVSRVVGQLEQAFFG